MSYALIFTVIIMSKEYEMEEWSICSLCLGTGNMLVWFGVLRYFGFFKTYNVRNRINIYLFWSN